MQIIHYCLKLSKYCQKQFCPIHKNKISFIVYFKALKLCGIPGIGVKFDETYICSLLQEVTVSPYKNVQLKNSIFFSLD